jgi:hypothetical protein
MPTATIDRTGIMIVRVWLEADEQGFRARMTHTLDATGGEEAMVTAAEPEDVYAAVRTWVEAFVDQDRRGVAGSDADR